MNKSLRSTFLASALIVLLSVPRPAMAWGNTGHEAVACVAWKQLDQYTKDKVFALLQQVPTIRNAAKTVTIPGFAEWSKNMPAGLSQDDQHMFVFMRAATWPDSIKHTFFHDSDRAPLHPSAPAGAGFADRNSYGYWHFVDTPTGSGLTPRTTKPAMPKSCTRFAVPAPVSSLPDVPVPNAATQVKVLGDSLASSKDASQRAYDLIWLEHIVGDVHQPLHNAVRFVDGVGDTGGNCVAITVPKGMRSHFKAVDGTTKAPVELHAFWDGLPGVGGQMDTQMAATYASTLPAATRTQAYIADPLIWAKESNAMALKDVYTGPIGGNLGAPKAFVITDAYYNTADADVKARIALAGARLAILLTQALKN